MALDAPLYKKIAFEEGIKFDKVEKGILHIQVQMLLNMKMQKE